MKKQICLHCYYSAKCGKVITGLVCGVNTTDGICPQCGQPEKNQTVWVAVEKGHTCDKFKMAGVKGGNQ